MIVKILTRNNPSYGSLLKYVAQEGKDKQKDQVIITHNLRSDSITGYTHEFIRNESFRNHPRSNQTYLYHEILSFSSKEEKQSITKEMIQDIARQYIELRGNQGLYFGASHTEKDHVHIHFCISGVEYRTGKAFRLSKENLHDLKTKIQEYHKEKYPEISQSFPDHGKGKACLTDKEWQAANRDKRSLKREDIRSQIQDAFSKSKSQNEFLEILRNKGIHHYERNGFPTGIVYEDMKFRFSRLGIEKEELSSLPVDKTEEQKALNEIQNLRQERKEKDKEIDKDEIPFNDLTSDPA